MGGGNGAKAAAKRELAQKKAGAAGPTSQLKANAAAMTIKCKTCMQTFMSTTKAAELNQHAENKHSKTVKDCFPDYVEPAGKAKK